jgi:hypothetical protein
LHLSAAVSKHDDATLGSEAVRSVKNMRQQWFTCERMEYFRQFGTHPFAESGSQNHHA